MLLKLNAFTDKVWAHEYITELESLAYYVEMASVHPEEKVWVETAKERVAKAKELLSK